MSSFFYCSKECLIDYLVTNLSVKTSEEDTKEYEHIRIGNLLAGKDLK